MKKFLLLFVVVAIAGCASSPSIHRAPANDLQLTQVLSNVNAAQNQVIRWGGAVVEVNNQSDFAEVTLVQFPLNRIGKPVATLQSDGRFIVRTEQFLDPLIYHSGALITVLGTVSELRSVAVDERMLQQPVIELQQVHVWPDNYGDRQHPYNPKHDAPFLGYGYYGTGSYSP